MYYSNIAENSIDVTEKSALKLCFRQHAFSKILIAVSLKKTICRAEYLENIEAEYLENIEATSKRFFLDLSKKHHEFSRHHHIDAVFTTFLGHRARAQIL